MSRLLSKTLIPHGRFFFLRRFKEPTITTASPNLVCFSSHRHFSSKPQLIEIDLDSATSKTEAEAAILKKLNEFVRRIIFHNSTPNWLPFAPGSSFWVPPHQITATKIANLVDKVTNPLTDEESLSLSSPFGWPSSSFFIPPPSDDSASTQEDEANMELNNIAAPIVKKMKSIDALFAEVPDRYGERLVLTLWVSIIKCCSNSLNLFISFILILVELFVLMVIPLKLLNLCW